MRRTLAIPAALGLLGAIGVSLFIGSTDSEKRPAPITVDGQTIEFPYTNDNSGEDLLIYANAESYTDGLSHAQVYLAVVNNSGKDQDVELMAYFDGTDKRVDDVSALVEVTREEAVPVIENVCTDVTSTTTSQKEKVCADRAVRNDVRQVHDLAWLPLNLLDRTEGEKSKENALVAGKRKADDRFVAGRKSQGFAMKKGEVVYYKLIIQYQPNQTSSFYVEAIGSKGGYGHLN